MISRREILGAATATVLAGATPAPLPVAIARADRYSEDLTSILGGMFDSLGGLKSRVSNKTVTIKLNLTGSPALRLRGRAPALTHYSHPRLAGALAHLLVRAGARRVRFVESCWGTANPLEEYLLDSGWNVRELQSIGPGIEFENTNARGSYNGYAPFPVPGTSKVFRGYMLNRAYLETDVLVSLAKLKEHATCGVTLTMKNLFGITPASIYGDDAGIEDPNEAPTKGRVKVCHLGERQPARIAPAEADPAGSRNPGDRVPRITVELCSLRPPEIAIIDGIDTVRGGEGPWIRGIEPLHAGLLFAGFNAVSTDAAAVAAMGYDPRARRGTAPFMQCENTLLLAEAAGLGSANIGSIPILGVPLESARVPFSKV